MSNKERINGDGYNLSGELLILFDRNERLFHNPEFVDKAHQIFDLLLQQNQDKPDLYEMQLVRAFDFAHILGNQLDVNLLDKLRQALSHLSKLNKIEYRRPRFHLTMLYSDRLSKNVSAESSTTLEQVSDLTWVVYLLDPENPKPQKSFYFCLVHLDEIAQLPAFEPDILKEIKGTFEVIHHQVGDHEIVVILTKAAPNQVKDDNTIYAGDYLYLGPYLIN